MHYLNVSFYFLFIGFINGINGHYAATYFINVSFIRSYICYYICGLYKGGLRQKILVLMVCTI